MPGPLAGMHPYWGVFVRRSRRYVAFRALVALSVSVWLVGGLAPDTLTAAGADVAIIPPSGAITNIGISSDLNCSANVAGDTSGEFFGSTACATEISVDGTTYGPASIPAGNSPGGFIPVNQSDVTGTGSGSDPYDINTTVDVADTGLQIAQSDSFVLGQTSYRTDVRVANTTGAPIDAVLYRGADCYLHDSDLGFGSVNAASGAVACVAPDLFAPSQAGTQVEQWTPLTSGSSFFEGGYASVWGLMSSGEPFPDSCDCTADEDNGAGLSWSITVPPNSSVTVSQLTTIDTSALRTLQLVALGDSYSSGEGAASPPVTASSDPGFLDGTDTKNDQCHRSQNAYPELLKSDLAISDDSFTFAACSGALLSELTNQLNKDNPNAHKKKYAGQWNEPAQLDHIASATGSANNGVGLVTLSIGGNDAGFAAALSNCVHGAGHGKNAHCTAGFLQSQMNRAVEVFKDGKRETVWSGGTWDPCTGCRLGARHYGPGGRFVHDDGYVVDVPSLHSLFLQIHKRAPNAQIRVLGYPGIVPQPTAKTGNCVVGHKFLGTAKYVIDRSDLSSFYNLAQQLDDTIRDQVQTARRASSTINIQFVDTRAPFKGHLLCDASDPWINGVIMTALGVSPFSFHPNAVGQSAFADAVMASLSH